MAGSESKGDNGLTLAPGVYPDVPEEAYHADPAPPSLSASIASIMCSRSPLHAWHAHPRLNPDFQRVEKQSFDLGTVAHAVLLGTENPCHVVDAPDWRTNAAKEVRDEARRHGLIPILAHQHETVEAMVASVRARIEDLDVDPSPFTDGLAEQTLVWEEQGVMCRARLDWLRDDHRAVDDFKSTGATAHPGEWSKRRLWDMGADVQVAMYRRGVKALTGVDPEFRYVVAENQPPYGLSVVSLAPAALTLGNAKLDWAIAKWRECLATGKWPSYAEQVVYAELPPWEDMRWLEERALEEELAA